MNSTTNKRNTDIGSITYATKFASNAKPYEIFMNKSVNPAVLSYKNGNNTIHSLGGNFPSNITNPQENDLLVYIDGQWININGSEILPSQLTTTVNIPSAQILAMGTTPIELLPAPGANMYYDVEKVILEYTYGGVQYATSTILFISSFSTGVIGGMINKAFNVYATAYAGVGNLELVNEVVYTIPFSLNEPITLQTFDSVNPTLGNGTLRAIITYTVRTFGA